MNIVIINLTRFGDLLQLQPTILGLAAKGHKICLICLENFITATPLIRGLSHVIALPGSKFLHGLDQDWRIALHDVENIIQDLEQNFPTHMVVNTTSTLGSRLLAKRLASYNNANIPILGFGLDDDGFGINGDMWSTFLQGASTERLNCPFNLVDMFRAACNVANEQTLWGLQEPSQQVSEQSLQLISKNLPHDCQGFVAFQLGASNKKRQWPVEYFAKLGAKLWQEHKLCPVLLGSKAEKHLGMSYKELACELPFINTIGSTDILHLAGILKHCKMLITNDTGTMHLAAGLKIPCLAFFLATAQAWDTGPYMPNCCCLEPALHCHPCAFHKPCIFGEDKQACLHGISAETVYFLADNFLKSGTWPKCPQNEVRVWLTTQDDNGFASLDCLSGHDQEERSQWLMIQRYFYRRILDKHYDFSAKPPSSSGLSETLRQEVSSKLNHATELLLLLDKCIQIMQVLPTAQTGERILLGSNNLQNTLLESQHLKALAHLWGTLSQEQGGDLSSFLKLVQTLRIVLLEWQKAMQESGT